MKLRWLLRLEINYMHLEYKHYRNKICTLLRVRKRKYYDTFSENRMANMKQIPGKESINFYIDGKKKSYLHQRVLIITTNC